MSEIIKITESQQVSLSVLRMLNDDTAAARKAMEFINMSSLKLELFRDSYYTMLNKGDGSNSPEIIGARVDAAIEHATIKLTVF